MKIKIIFAFCILCILTGCGKQINNTFIECFHLTSPQSVGVSMDSQSMSLSCEIEIFFMEAVSKFSKCSDVYLIKGKALDVYEYGRNIELVEDLKGNFPKNVKTFVAWGGGMGFISLGRMENLTWYDKGDILIMLLIPAYEWPAGSIPSGFKWFEKPGDFTTLTCVRSIVKLTGNRVTGRILPNVDTMPWGNFQRRLNNKLNK